MLPRIKINYLNGQLGTIPESEDGLFVLAANVIGREKFPIETLHSVRTMDDVAALGLSNGDGLYNSIEYFYNEAGEGVEVLLYNLPGTTISSVVDQGSIGHIVALSNRRCRGIFFVSPMTGADQEQANEVLEAAQSQADDETSESFAPLFVAFNASALSHTVDFHAKKFNRVALFEGTEDGDETMSLIGLLAGRLASIPVHRNVGRVKDGAIKYSGEVYVGSESVSVANVEGYHARGFITPRTYVGLSGYYIADDCMACDPTDDYAHLTARRTIDKAYRIAYETLVQFMLDEIEVNEDGTMQNGIIKTWQQAVENAINSRMTAAGELSANDGEGCVCYIDAKQNVLATGTVKVTLKVRPYGYARYIDVDLGFQVNRQ